MRSTTTTRSPAGPVGSAIYAAVRRHSKPATGMDADRARTVMPFASHRTARFPSVTGPFAESPPDRRVIQLATERKTEAHANSKDNSYPAGASTSGPTSSTAAATP